MKYTAERIVSVSVEYGLTLSQDEMDILYDAIVRSPEQTMSRDLLGRIEALRSDLWNARNAGYRAMA